MKKVYFGMAFLAATFWVSPASALAGPVGPTDTSGLQFFASGGELVVYFAGSDAGFNSVLYLSSPVTIGPFFPNHSTPIGASQSLGFFAAGTLLTFRLNVLTTGNDFFTGPANLNPDNLVHAGVTQWQADAVIPVDGFIFGFEDQFGGGDRDYNDHQFVVAPVTTAPASAVPEPATLFLLTVGIGAGALFRKRSNTTTR
jgi:hypothetical protein